jgi:hypothetical protein
LGGNPFSAAAVAQALGGGGFHANSVCRDVKGAGDIYTHLLNVWSKLWVFGDDDGIHITY